jgi:aspartate aminotransferase
LSGAEREIQRKEEYISLKLAPKEVFPQMNLSTRIKGISPSPTLTIDAKTKQMIQEGVDVVNFSVGEPDFDTPRHIKEAAIEAINQGFTKYTPASGTLELRKAICEKLARENGLEYQPGDIVVSNGGKHSLYNVYQAIGEPGDEFILQAPYWVSYPEMIKLAGGVPVVIETDEKTGFRMTAQDIKARITARTKAITLNSPSNPTGAVYTREELKAIADLAVENNLWVISDEIYEKMLYDGAEHVSIASFGPAIKKLTITVNGVSKAYAMTGWRIGYTASEPNIAKSMADLQSHSTSNPASISQKASLAALTGSQEPVAEMVREFNRRREHIVDRLNAFPGVSCLKPQGAFYVFPNVSEFFGKTIRGRKIMDTDVLAQVILEEGRVALVPGSGFGAPNNLRISYATSLERITEGLNRIETLLKEAE